MKIKFLAHASFLLTSVLGTKVLTDPYDTKAFDGAIGYQPIFEQADLITTSHTHEDHNYIAPHHQQTRILNQAGTYIHQDIQINGHSVFHDKNSGKDRGENIIFVFQIDDLAICHLGDLGHVLNQELIKKLGNIDILLIPVGGVYTIDAKEAWQTVQKIAPKICLPMHYKTDKLAFDLAPVTNFITQTDIVKPISFSEVALNKKDLPKILETWILSPANY